MNGSDIGGIGCSGNRRWSLSVEMRIAVLMTCHNRRETTKRCLLKLLPQIAAEDRIFLVDDGSSDRTGEEIVRLFDCSSFAEATKDKSIVRLIQGDGNLYWAKGMALAWRTALESETGRQLPFSHFLWLNDDVMLKPDALTKMLDVVRTGRSPDPTVIVGELENAQGEIVYGTRGDLFTGNFVLVPRSVYEKVGVICGDYRHAWADSDYALRCKRMGVRVESCGVVGQCEGHSIRPSLLGMSLSERWQSLFDPKGWCVHDLWLYRKRNWGVLAAVVSAAHFVLHVLWGER